MKKLNGLEIELGDLWKFTNGNDPKHGLFLIISLCDDSVEDHLRVKAFNLTSQKVLYYRFLSKQENYSLVSRGIQKNKK